MFIEKTEDIIDISMLQGELQSALTDAMSSVVANFSLINKVYMPKYIFPLSKCVFVGINFLLSQIPLYVILLTTGTGINYYHIFLPFSTKKQGFLNFSFSKP